jgi:hypothetical protein
MSTTAPWTERERLEWQLCWHERRIAEARHWLNWDHLPPGAEAHWRNHLKRHHRAAGKLRLALLSCT